MGPRQLPTARARVPRPDRHLPERPGSSAMAPERNPFVAKPSRSIADCATQTFRARTHEGTPTDDEGDSGTPVRTSSNAAGTPVRPALVELDPAPDRLVEEARRISQERVDEFLSEDAEDVFVCPERGIGSEAEVAGECHDRLAVCEEPQFPRVVRPNTKRVMLMLCQEDAFVLRRAATKRDVDPYEELAIWLGRESKPVKSHREAMCR